MKTCRHCGAVSGDDALTCKECGEMLGIIPDAPIKRYVVKKPVQTQEQTQQTDSADDDTNVQQQAQAAVSKHSGERGSRTVIMICAAAVAVLVLFILVFTRMNNKKTRLTNKELIVGTWKTDGHYSRFNSDGTAELDIGSGTYCEYSVNGGELTVNLSGDDVKYDIVVLSQKSMTLRENGEEKAAEPASFTRVKDDEIKDMLDDIRLNNANKNAELIYLSIESTCFEMVRNGMSINPSFSTDGAVAVEDLKDMPNILAQTAYYAIAQHINGGNLGYVYIKYDPVSTDYTGGMNIFIQWSEKKEGAVIGQCPNATKSKDSKVTFGEYHSGN